MKPTGRAEKGAPTEVDFDELWTRVYEPDLSRDYIAVRADRDIGALIINEMIQRLAIADLIVADITLPNANVYYEIGVRHAAKRDGCVLVGAEWADVVFDLQQMRQVRFPLADGSIGADAAAAAVAALDGQLERLKNGVSPVFVAVPGFPDAPEMEHLSAFTNAVAELSDFNADVRAVRIAPDDERSAIVQALLERHGGRRVVREAVVLELLRLVRDQLGWQAALDYIAGLPNELTRHPLILEQQALALAKSGKAAAAAARLEELIAASGPTPERPGLLGGRYKQLYRSAERARDRRAYRDKAIDAYRRGMEIDLNAYYSACNLPRLYRERREPGDEQLAAEAEAAATLACKTAIANGTADDWPARPCSASRSSAETWLKRSGCAVRSSVKARRGGTWTAPSTT